MVCICVAKRRCNAHDNTRRFILRQHQSARKVHQAWNESIAKLYSKWNEINREKLSLYHEKKKPDIPLEDNKEFRSIKNVIVKAAVEFNNTQHGENYTPQHHTASAFGRILCQLLRAISQSYDNRDRKLRSQVDGKLRSKIAQKKLALSIRPEQSDYENSYEQSM